MRRAFGVLLFACVPSFGQIVTGAIAGRLVDPSRAAVGEAQLELMHTSTARVRSVSSTETGEFVFSGLEAGNYVLTATKDGFKRFSRENIGLESGQRLVLGDLTLDLGSVAETVTVQSQVVAVATQSADRSDLITTRQAEGLLNLGRNITSFVALMPGVVVTNESNALGRITDFQVNGSRRTQNNVSIDGLPATDVGNAFNLKLNVSQDAVAEVKVLLSNYQAEYGRAAGGNVQIITKSGTRDFHGLGSYYKRHEQFNANNFFNNRNGLDKPRYRFNSWTYNVGGPVYIPKVFNRDKNKLFFFWSQEFWPTTLGFTGTVTVPTGLERIGDFSQSVDLNNRLIPIRDPQTGQPFPGNRIPAGRLDADGQALLNIFPEANFFDRSISNGNYNYTFTTETQAPVHTDTLKLDYVINERNSVVFGYNGFYEKQTGTPGFGWGGTQNNWPQWLYTFNGRTQGLTTRYTRVINPNTVAEVYLGWLHHPETHTYEEDTIRMNSRADNGFNAGQFYPQINPLGLIPNATFAGVPTAATLNKDGRFPLHALNNLLNFDNKFTWNQGRHTWKAGAYVEWFQRDIGEPTDFAGSFDFGRNVNNPLDTGYAYSNAMLGVFNSYTEASSQPQVESRNILAEFFVQDNWRIASRLTLDYGLRLSLMPPIVEKNNAMAGFVPSRFDPAQQVVLIAPAMQGNQRVGLHPVTGETYPATLIGAIAPGVGNPTNGMLVSGADPDYPRALNSNPGLLWAPRVGFAYDVFGNTRTALRGGFGMFYNRPNFGTWLRPFAAQPPLIQTPIINYGTIGSFLSSSGLLFPTNVLGLERDPNVPSVMNFSLSVQHNLGWSTVLDVGYVGSLGRHLLWNRPMNAIPFGANFDPANSDPTLSGRPLAPAFLRPIVGYNNVNIREAAGSSNYHSLQVTVNRRFQRGLQFGASWTWSKAMDYNDEDTQAISSLVPLRVWNYGLAAFDRTHNLKINWLWDVPGPRNNPVMRQVFGGWQISGIASFISGRPLGVGFNTTTPIDITGSPTDSARIVVTGNPVLSKSERTFEQNFNTSVFALPAQGTYGNSAKTVIRGPGINNWDIAVFKNFPIHEQIRLQFRAEMYNAFNHTQFNAWDTTARFDPVGNQVNARFGQATAAQDARIIQLSLRAYF